MSKGIDFGSNEHAENLARVIKDVMRNDMLALTSQLNNLPIWPRN